MIPFNHVAAPSIDRGVEARLRRLDPSLRLTWSPYALDVFSGNPILTTGCVNPDVSPGEVEYVAPGRPVDDPSFYLWRKSDTCSHHFYVMAFPTPDPGFTYRQVLALERDLARFLSPREILSTMTEAADRRAKQAKAAQEQLQLDKIAANESRINDLVLNGRSGTRDGKAFSAPGVSRRSTPGRVFMDPREDGWETPDNE